MNSKIIKIQSVFRSNLARRKMAKDARLDIKKLQLQKKKSSKSQEELALREFKERLMKKSKLTPEAFFRACDPQYSKSIPVNTFKNHLQE